MSESIHLADKRVPFGVCAREPGRGWTGDEVPTGVRSRGIGEDRPMGCGGPSLAGRESDPSPPLSLPLAAPPSAFFAPGGSVAGFGLTGRRLTCKGTFPGGIPSEGWSGTGKCTELRFFADSAWAWRNWATVIFGEESEACDVPRGRVPIGEGGTREEGE